jgi:hypothetical protein
VRFDGLQLNSLAFRSLPFRYLAAAARLLDLPSAPLFDHDGKVYFFTAGEDAAKSARGVFGMGQWVDAGVLRVGVRGARLAAGFFILLG